MLAHWTHEYSDKFDVWNVCRNDIPQAACPTEAIARQFVKAMRKFEYTQAPEAFLKNNVLEFGREH